MKLSKKMLRVALIAPLLSLVLILSGCSKMSAAAIIGDQEISLTTIQNSVDSIIAERALVDTAGLDLPEDQLLVVSQAQFHITVELLKKIGDQFGINISKTDVSNEREFIIEQLGGAEALPRALVGAVIAIEDLDLYILASSIYEQIGQILLSQGVAEADLPQAQQLLLVDKAAELKVTLNPRYGIWDAKTASIQPTSGNDAVEPSN